MESDWIPRDDLATRVVVLRTQMGLSRRQFAQLTGLTENQLQGIEDGRSPHKLPEKVQAIHDATGVSREWLMWGGPLDGENPRPEGPGGGVDSTDLGLKVRSSTKLSYRGEADDTNVIPMRPQEVAA